MIQVQERETSEWSLPARALHKLYRTVYEVPRRKRIASHVLRLRPSPPVDPETGFSVHMLVCQRDVDMAVCTARVANLAFGIALPWIFHDDGSLRDEDEEAFRTQLPGCIVARRPEADRTAAEKLAAYPEILKYRQHQVMALKLVDVKLWGKGERLAYIDSDILFFRRPDFFIEALSGERAGNYFNKDIANAYVQPADQIERAVGVRPLDRLNAGLWVMDEKVIDLDKIERWLKHPAFRENLYAYTLDQTFISMLANDSEEGVAHLPPTYDVAFLKDVRTSVNKHYVGRIRHGYELEGLAYLLEEGEFKQRWDDFASGSGSASPQAQVAVSERRT